MLLILMSVVACNPEDRLKVGMTESDVIRIMGRPTRVIDDPNEVKQELQRDLACSAAASRALVYNRGRERKVQVHVGFDAKGTVRCVLESLDLMQTRLLQQHDSPDAEVRPGFGTP